MTGNLVNWFIYCVVVSFFTAYVSSRAMGPGTDYLRVFQIAGCVELHGLLAGAAAELDLVEPPLGLDLPIGDRRPALRRPDRRHLRLAVAEVKITGYQLPISKEAGPDLACPLVIV